MLKLSAVLTLLFLMINPAAAQTVTLLALGDSLTAGYGLQPSDAFPVKLEAALQARGHDVKVINGGIAGDTALDGASRVDWALSEEVDAVIVEFGANDALRGLPVPQAEQALTQALLGAIYS
jgi:acyl-CoA thioesterase-1